jgi:hypothetical protein
MRRSSLAVRLLISAIGVGLVLQMTSCGTIIYPERRGQPPGRLDPSIVILDAAGLLLFFIPGIIAFAVDFADGTIYLPPDRSANFKPPSSDSLQVVHTGSRDLTPQQIEQVVQERTGQAVRLEPGTYQAMKLKDLREFSPNTVEQMQSGGAAAAVDFSSKPN